MLTTPVIGAVMDQLLPTSSSSARIDVEVREPWQLVARSGAGWLAIGLTMPAVIGALQMLSIRSLTGTSLNWSTILIALRGGRVVAGVIGLIGVWRLLRAPCIDRQYRVLVLALFFATAIASPVLASENNAASALSIVVAIASWIALIEALRKIEMAAGDGGRASGLWRVLTVVAILVLVISLPTIPIREPLIFVGILLVVRTLLIVVCFAQLRQELC